MKIEEDRRSSTTVEISTMTAQQLQLALGLMGLTLQQALESWVRSSTPDQLGAFAQFRDTLQHKINNDPAGGLSDEQLNDVLQLVKNVIDGLMPHVEYNGTKI